MVTNQFFEESREQSVIKSEIVEKYFFAWAKIIIGNQKRFGNDLKICYIDLFAGPGRYKDGQISTPFRVLSKAIKDKDLSKNLVTIFNDKDSKNAQTLEQTIKNIPDINKLRFEPQVWNREVGNKIAEQFESISKAPCLAFIDPWGYKGLSLKLVDAFLQDWGCDCIFFFNYARINAGLGNPYVKEHMQALFGAKTKQLSKELKEMKPQEREATIVNELVQSLQEFGHRFVLPFCFKSKTGKRTKHHLILVTKAFRGYDVMKEIMVKSSSDSNQGVATFTFSLADSNKQRLLFDLNRPLDDLEKMLLKDYKGKKISTIKLYEEHSVNKPYIKKNYKDILRKMEDSGKIDVMGRNSNRGFADYLTIQFP